MEGSSSGVRKGAWTKFEDDLLEACIKRYGEGKWHLVPQRTGLNRCRKSCRLRWINYLRPDIKRGDFSEDEVDLMTRLHKLLGNRWVLIAGRLPGRTSNDVKNFWNTHMRSKVESHKNVKQQEVEYTMKPHEVIKPVPRTFTKVTPYLQGKIIVPNHSPQDVGIGQVGLASSGSTNWWETVLEDKGDNVDYNPCSLLAEGDGTCITELWDEEFITSLTTQDCDSFLPQGQIWSDFLLDVNLWDNE